MSFVSSHLDVFMFLILLISLMIVLTAYGSPVPAYFIPIAITAPPMMF